MRSLVRVVALTVNVLAAAYWLWEWFLMATTEPGGLLRWSAIPYLVLPFLNALAPIFAIAAIVLVPTTGAKNR